MIPPLMKERNFVDEVNTVLFRLSKNNENLPYLHWLRHLTYVTDEGFRLHVGLCLLHIKLCPATELFNSKYDTEFHFLVQTLLRSCSDTYRCYQIPI